MKSFEMCISQICGLELASMRQGKYTVFGNSVAVVEGHNGIADYTEGKLSFVFGKSRLEICGEQLKIKCLEKGYAVVVGKILSVAVANV